MTCPVAVATIKTILSADYWPRHRLHTIARFGCNFEFHVTYLPTSPHGRTRYERSCTVIYDNQSNYKWYLQKNNHVQIMTSRRTCPLSTWHLVREGPQWLWMEMLVVGSWCYARYKRAIKFLLKNQSVRIRSWSWKNFNFSGVYRSEI